MQQITVADIFRLYDEGRSLKEIAESLNNEQKLSTEEGFRPLRWLVPGTQKRVEED